jgi:molecular chaperone Hsp33
LVRVTEQPPLGTGFDRVFGFSLPDRNARGRAVRLGPTLDRVLAAHDYPPAIKQLLAEALVLTALMGGLLKDPGSQLTMQAQSSEGIVELLVCDYLDGALRG